MGLSSWHNTRALKLIPINSSDSCDKNRTCLSRTRIQYLVRHRIKDVNDVYSDSKENIPLSHIMTDAWRYLRVCDFTHRIVASNLLYSSHLKLSDTDFTGTKREDGVNRIVVKPATDWYFNILVAGIKRIFCLQKMSNVCSLLRQSIVVSYIYTMHVLWIRLRVGAMAQYCNRDRVLGLRDVLRWSGTTVKRVR